MISIINLFIAIGTIMFFVICCAFGGLWLGAYIHHRGVSIGSGSRESFTGRVPEGEVFRLPEADDAQDTVLDDKQMTGSQADRAQRFLSSLLGKGDI